MTEPAVIDALLDAQEAAEARALAQHRAGRCHLSEWSWLLLRGGLPVTGPNAVAHSAPPCNWPRCNSRRTGKCFAWCKCRCHSTRKTWAERKYTDPCASCGAPAGKPCRTASGYVTKRHAARVFPFGEETAR